MKPDIQANMENRIEEITDQNTMFDIAIATIETVLGVTMTEESTTYYRYIDSNDGWDIAVTLEESISNGMITIAINKQLIGGMARLGTMTVYSNRTTSETLGNINTVLEREYVEDIFTAIFANVKNTDNASGDDT
jgi:hypothetical protein